MRDDNPASLWSSLRVVEVEAVYIEKPSNDLRLLSIRDPRAGKNLDETYLKNQG